MFNVLLADEAYCIGVEWAYLDILSGGRKEIGASEDNVQGLNCDSLEQAVWLSRQDT